MPVLSALCPQLNLLNPPEKIPGHATDHHQYHDNNNNNYYYHITTTTTTTTTITTTTTTTTRIYRYMTPRISLRFSDDEIYSYCCCDGAGLEVTGVPR
jgi:hypothetical protein